MQRLSGTCLLIAVFSVTVPGNDLQPTSFSIAEDAVRIGECYTFQVEDGAHLTLDLRYTHMDPGSLLWTPPNGPRRRGQCYYRWGRRPEPGGSRK